MSTLLSFPAPALASWADRLGAAGARLVDTGTGLTRVSDFGEPAAEFQAAAAGAVCCPLFDVAVVALDGADATAFLQGQFTNDVAALDVGAVQWSGWCSPKGRLLANFPLARVAADAYRMFVPADIAPSIVKRLRMFVLRSKVAVSRLEDVATIGLHGLPGALASQVKSAAGGFVVGLADGRELRVVATGDAERAWDELAGQATPVGSGAWDWLGIRAGIPVITASTQDRFVPQMLYWELHGVNFRKGCYPGQEIVARMQYRGRPKERLYRARVAVARAPAAGDALYAATFGDQTCGTVVNAVAVPGIGAEMLAVVQSAAAADAVHLTPDRSGPALQLLALPYPVPDPASTGPS